MEVMMSTFDASAYMKKKYAQEKNEGKTEARKDAHKSSFPSKKSTSNSFDASAYMKKKYAQNTAISEFGLDTLSTDIQNLYTTLNSVYSGWQTPETMSNTLSSAQSMYDRLGKYQEYRNKYGWEELPDLTELYNSLNPTIEELGVLASDYASHKNAESYTNEKTKLRGLYGMSSDEVKTKWDASKAYDSVQPYTTQIKKLETALSTRAFTPADEEYLKNRIAEETKRRDEAVKKAGYNSYDELEGIVGNSVNGQIAYTTSNGKNIKWEDVYNDAQYLEFVQPILNAPDFDEKSAYEKKDVEYDFINTGGAAFYHPHDYDAHIYNFINKDEDAVGKHSTIDTSQNSFNRDSVKREMSDEEIKVYNYVYNTQGPEKANEFLSLINDDLKQRDLIKKAQYFSEYAAEDPVGSSAFSLISNASSGVEWLGDVADYVVTGEMDYNTGAYVTSTIRGTVSNNYDWDIEGWDAFDFVYNSTMSGIDSALATTTLGGGGGVALGLSAAAQGTNDALERGLDDNAAFLAGLSSGANEMIFESVSIGNFKKLKSDLTVDGWKSLGKDIAKAMGVNASEEFFTEWANITYDNMVNGELSQAETKIRAYMNSGISEEEAKKMVASEQGVRLAEATASGAFIGLGFGGYAGGTSFYNTSSAGKSIRANGRTYDMFDIASNPEIGSAYETYTEYARKGINAENAKNAQVGRLYLEAESDARKTLNNKQATKLQKATALKNLGELSIVETENTIKKKAKEEFNVGDETKVTKTGETVDTKNIKVEGDKITVATEKGKVSVDDVILSERDAELAYVAKEIAKENGEDIANLFLEQYDGKTNVEAYQNSFNMVMQFAKGDFTFEEMMKHKGSLSATEVSKIYEETVLKAYKEQQSKIDKLIQDTADQRFYKGSIEDSAITNKVWKKLDTRQRKAITFIKGLAKATGMNLVLTYNPDSKTGGEYNKTKNIITIDVAKFKDSMGVLKETIIPTMSHEMTHWMEEKSPELYRKMNDLVFSALQEADGISESLRLSLEYKRHKAKGRDYSKEELRSEIVARACENILSMSEQGQKLFDSLSESEKQTLGAKIKEILHNLMDMIKKMLGTYKSDTYEAKALQQYQDKLQEIVKIWDEMLLKSVEANQALEKSGAFNHQASADGDVKFQMRETVEVTKYLIAVHNANAEQLLDAIKRGQFIMPSIAVTNKGHTAFGDISIVFYRYTIDPETNSENKLYGADAWTPTQTTLKINPKFDNAKTLDAVKDIKKSIGQNWSQIFNVDSTQFKKTITDAKGSLYAAYSENIGMQTAYAMKNGLISSLPMNNGRVDVDALKNSLDEKLNKDEVWREYKKWLGEISNTIITEYDKASTQDILDSMKAQPNTAKVFKLSESGELTVPAAEYKSIDEMRQNKHRLSENAEESAKAVGAEFISWANNLSNRIGVDAKSIVNAINSSFDSRYNINGIVKSFNENGVSITNADAKSIQELYKKAVELPTLYFEAKPQRAVGLNEVAMVVLPDVVNTELKAILEENNIPYTEYESGNKQSRLDALNSVESVKFSDRETDSVYDIMGERDRILKENEQFRKEIENLKERVELEKKVTNGTVLNNNSLLAAAAHLRNIANSNMDKVELAKALKEVYSFILNSKELTWDELFSRCYGVAEQIYAEMKPTVEVNEFYKGILSDIKKTKVSFNESQKMEARHAFDKNWNRYFFGRITLANDGIPLESMWADWSQQYPDIFRADINDGDMVRELYDVLGSLQSASEIAMEYNEEETKRYWAQEIYNQFWNVSTITTTADKYDKQIKLLKAKHRSYMAEVRDSYKSRMEQKVKDQKLVDDMYYGKKLIEKDKEIENQKIADDIHYGKKLHKQEQKIEELSDKLDVRTELYRKLRERKDKEIALAKEHGKERLQKYKDNAERKTRIQRITANALTLKKWLLKNNKDYHIHEAMKGPIIKLLNAIDFSSKSMLEKGEQTQRDVTFAKAFSDVKTMLNDATNMVVGLEELYGQDLAESIQLLSDAALNRVGDNSYIINTMSNEELFHLDKMIRHFKSVVTRLNEFHVLEHNKGVVNLGNEFMEHGKKLGNIKNQHGTAGKFLKFRNRTPYSFFKDLGPVGEKLFKAFRKGWDKFAFNIKKVIDYAEETYTTKEVKEWSKETKQFTLKQPDGSNRTFEMSIAQIMALHCVSKQNDARTHLFSGGMTLKRIDKKGKVISDYENISLSVTDLQTILDTLTDRQKEVADKLQKFMNTVCSDWGNEISMARFGSKMFGIPDYFPIKVSEATVPTDNTKDIDNASLFRLLNMAFTKSRVIDASQSIEIGDIFDIFAQHSSDMAKYNALALPVLDFNKFYSIKGKDSNGKEYGVVQTLKSVFGDEANGYIRRFVRDLNSSQNVSRDVIGNTVFKNAKVASVAANLRVILLQPTAYFKASAVMDNKYLLKAKAYIKVEPIGMFKKLKKAISLAEKYCGIVQWKSLGYYDTDISKGITEKIKHADSIKDKVIEKAMKGAEWADKATFGTLWVACEFETRDTRKDLKVGSEEYYKAIADRLSDVIYATQVVDSTMTRSDMMRSSDGKDKMLTTFGSEPTIAYNMLLDLVTQTHRDSQEFGAKEAWKKNGNKIRKVVTAYVITNAMAALVESAFDALRDDDDDEMDVEQFLKLYFKNFGFDMSIGNKLPYIKELYSIMQGYSSSRMDTQWATYLFKVYDGFSKHFEGKGDWKKTLKNTIKGMSDLTGLPAYNVYRDAIALLEKLNLIDW
jgi:hypothetical protein